MRDAMLYHISQLPFSQKFCPDGASYKSSSIDSLSYDEFIAAFETKFVCQN